MIIGPEKSSLKIIISRYFQQQERGIKPGLIGVCHCETEVPLSFALTYSFPLILDMTLGKSP